ncbi:sulfite exporter TauE/SafE family protein 3-like [Papaver somniferum]|nr:sulfite exporter TauE/SafE family protein 3-like [Papaver somniferum]
MSKIIRDIQGFISCKSLAIVTIITVFFLSCVVVSADKSFKLESLSSHNNGTTTKLMDTSFSQQKYASAKSKRSDYQHLWPEMRFGWRIVVGSIIAFIASAFGSVGGVGGGGIYVPMLILVIGFDAKSSVPISKCMIMGTAASTVYCNLKRRHPTLEMPVIDYNLAVLIQPMLMLGISIGVGLGGILADWMVTVLLIVLFSGTSAMMLLKGTQLWKKETIAKKVQEDAARIELNDVRSEEVEQNRQPSDASNSVQKKANEVPVLKNVYWKELGVLVFVWVSFLVMQILQIRTTTCSTVYWVLSSMQIPVSVGVTLYQAVCFHKGKKVLEPMGEAGTELKVHQLVLYCFLGVLAGMVGGLLGLGGGFILGPMFLQIGVPPQVASATASFAMMFSSSMSVIEFYLLKRFPIPYSAYFLAVAIVSAVAGQYVVRKLIIALGRASLIVFLLVTLFFVSAFLLGGVGISNMVKQIQHKEYMGFQNLCHA